MAASTLPEEGRTVNWPRMRPRFVVEVSCSADRVMSALREGTDGPDPGIGGHFSERHGVLTIPDDERQFWSTQLGLTLEEGGQDADGGQRPTRVLGVFSPHPDIWTAYVFAIGTLAVIVLSGVLYAVVQLSMGQPPWCLLASLIAALLGGLVYTSTLVGQGLAAGEMYQLRSFLRDRLDEAETLGQRDPTGARSPARP